MLAAESALGVWDFSYWKEKNKTKIKTDQVSQGKEVIRKLMMGDELLRVITTIHWRSRSSLQYYW